MAPIPFVTATDALHSANAITRPLTETRASALIFGPGLYPHFVNWQTNIDDPEQRALYPTCQAWKNTVKAVQQEDIGGIPSPPIFKAFMNTPRVKEHFHGRDEDLAHIFTDVDDEEAERGPEDLLIARVCKHTIHPGNPCLKTEICPVCIMKQCLASLERIAFVWRIVGGPYRPGRNETGVYMVDPGELAIYLAVKSLWIVEKKRWANLVGVYEDYAARERAWEEDSRRGGFEIPGAVREASTCVEALELAGQSPFLVEGWSDVFVPTKRSRKCGAGDELQGSSVSSGEQPCSPPETPKMDSETLPYSTRTSDGTEEADDNTADYYLRDHSDSPPADRTAARADSPTASPRTKTSANPTVYTSSPPPPSSPPQSRSSSFVPSTPMFGVYFPDDLPSPSTRRSLCYLRTSKSYKQGKHASPYGSIKVDTSFANNSAYDEFGVAEEEELEISTEALDKPVQEAGERFAGFTDVDLDSEDEGKDSDWSDTTDEGDGEDDLMTVVGRSTVGGKRLPGQTGDVNFRRPVFTFSWPHRREEDEEGDTVSDTISDTSSDEFDDDEVEEAMRDMDNVGAVSLAEPDLLITPRRRSHDEFVECEEVDEESHVKRSRL
ncbi:hypothetical protein J4E93_001275 [Alternaria ventricosa]|uniref:uncharacterized protein n=1 Tax=Alternaria ventricosa TaxID=1187951 RepID=UPI0020C4118C|nr:uncharacterized protein J4E93_001275 [Alternaria ventricosa]KAI4653509.1 hypothetical protein J4E93_001275 [Alternaria ventricosa]